MTAGRLPTPAALKVAAGNRGKRRIAEEPHFAKLMPELPDDLDADERAYLQKIAPELTQAGVLTVVDGDALVSLARAKVARDRFHRLRRDVGEKEAIKLGYVREERRADVAFGRWSREVGLTAIGRAKLAGHLPERGLEDDRDVGLERLLDP